MSGNDDPAWADPAFLRQQAKGLIDFYLPRSVDRDDGGFIAQIADDGSVFDRRTRHLIASCRYTHGFALGHMYGLGAGCRDAASRCRARRYLGHV